MSPSGEQVRLESSGYTADVVTVGGALRTLESAGRPLVRSWSAEEMMPVFSGAVLAPWPNRIGDGAYSFGGQELQAPINEVERGNALHGLVGWAEWEVAERSADRVRLSYRLRPNPAYPWQLALSVTYALSAEGLAWTLTARNESDSAAPYGGSVHPYFVAAATGHVDDWRLELPAASYLVVDDERLLPVEVVPVAGTPFDFTQGRVIGDTFVDHAFTELAAGDDGLVQARLLSADGTGVEVSWDAASPWVQVHTADRPEERLNRTGLAIEPMTCPPDAFRTGIDLVVLEPGAEHSVSWHVRAV
ncbi:aldose 1-epimerase [Motilibacter peucedani]|uniref:Aldose 1-epimerase n=1 Tax=Motilibacter peucedani TaxID=598650 RepID=A0A420XTS2_9ACTN|nr:aldose 1-epimerase family protein [Motilibacter peucedani]RKS80246.1 aldose 1-epimerase [Motilibacter peucedani]